LEYYKIEYAKNVSKNAASPPKKVVGEQYTSRVKLACELNDRVALQTALKDMWAQYGGFSEDRASDVNSLLCQVADNLLPLAQKYILWAVNSNSSFFNPANEIKKPKLLFNIQQKDGTPAKPKLLSQINDMIIGDDLKNMLKIPQEELMKIFYSGPQIKSISDRIKTDLRKLNDLKNDLTMQIQSLDIVVYNSIYSKLSPEKAIQFVHWIDSVNLILISNFSINLNLNSNLF
jgi:hypothetical protein